MMKKLFVLMVLMGLTMTIGAQGLYTREYNDKALVKKAQKWLKKNEWRQGFTKADAHESVNVVEFYRQYQKNPEQWQAMFRWLQNTDVTSIEKGRHPIPGTKLTVSVEDSENGPLAKRQSESHFHHIDFQWAVKGTERFGIIDHLTSKPNCAWKEDVVHYDYDVKKARFMDSKPGEFFIFFPGDWHIAKVNNDTNDQNIRVIVVKVDYIDD
jgi:YhcH/YjgK/YiaL family protein